MSYEGITLKKEITINTIISIQRFEHINDLTFEEETHPFWEFVLIDKGTLNVTAASSSHTLYKDTIIFHKPEESHHIYTNSLADSGFSSVCFVCDSPAIKFFENKILEIGPSERALISNIIKEAQHTYSALPTHPGCKKLTRRKPDSIPFASEQLIQLYLQQLLIQLIRNNSTDCTVTSVSKSERTKSEAELFYKIISYMEENIHEHLTIRQICKDNLLGRALLQKLFKDNAGCGVIDYFLLMKITAAKQLIQGGQMNFSQIADKLGYNSIHYFSRQFKNLTGMTPSEYAASLVAASEPSGK